MTEDKVEHHEDHIYKAQNKNSGRPPTTSISSLTGVPESGWNLHAFHGFT